MLLPSGEDLCQSQVPESYETHRGFTFLDIRLWPHSVKSLLHLASSHALPLSLLLAEPRGRGIRMQRRHSSYHYCYYKHHHFFSHSLRCLRHFLFVRRPSKDLNILAHLISITTLRSSYRRRI